MKNMKFKNDDNENLKEFGAVTLMQLMLEKYIEKNNISMNEALKKFTSSKTYEALFDYDGTGLWKEGPLYLLSFYEKAL